MAFRAVSTRASLAAATDESITKPTGTVEGDVLVLVVSQDNVAATITWPAGFVEVATESPQTTALDGQRFRVALLVAGASEPASYTVNSSAAGSAQLAAYSGRAASTTPHAVKGSADNTGTASPSTVTATGVTTTVDGCDIIYAGAVDNTSSGTHTWSAPGGYTDRGIVTSGAWTCVGLADLVQATAGATGNVSATFTHVGNAAKTAFLIALAPLGGGGGSPSSAIVDRGRTLGRGLGRGLH